MPHRDGFLAIRYYPVPGMDLRTGEIRPASGASTYFGISCWIREDEGSSPTMGDEHGVEAEYSTITTGFMGSGSEMEIGEGYGNAMFFDTTGLSKGEFVERLVMLSGDESSGFLPAAEIIENWYPVVYLTGFAYRLNVYEGAISGSRTADFDDGYACGVFDIGIYSGDTFMSLATFRVLAPEMDILDSGDMWDHPNIPEPKHTYYYGSEEFFVASLVGPAPAESGLTDITDGSDPGSGPDPGGTGEEPQPNGLYIRFYPVKDVYGDTQNVFLGIGTWMISDEERHYFDSMISGDASGAESITVLVHDPTPDDDDDYELDTYLTAFWFPVESSALGRFSQMRIALTQPGGYGTVPVGRDMEPLEVYIGGIGYEHTYNESDNSWVASGNTNDGSAGVVEIGIWDNAEFLPLTVFRFKGRYFEGGDEGLWNSPLLPKPTGTVFMEEGTGILKARLQLAPKPAGSDWTDFKKTKEIRVK